MTDTKALIESWVAAKKAEGEAKEWRYKVEESLLTKLGFSQDFTGYESFSIDGYKVKITSRASRKVDPELLQELAAQHGLSQHLQALFRWKAEINGDAWKSTDPAITTPLLGAVTTTPTKPSFSITQEQ